MGKGRRNKAKSKSKNRPPPHNTITITPSTELSETSSTELSATTSTELSTDILLFHILPRLPVQSLRRFRFLSKQCYSYISNPTPEFAKMQLHHQNQNQNQNHYKLLVLSDTTFRTIDCENPNKEAYIDPQVNYKKKKFVCGINDSEDPNKHKAIFCVSGPFPLKVVDHYDLLAVTSFHEMVCAGIIKHSKKICYYDYDYKYCDNLIIWNPVTGEYKILSKPGSHKDCYHMSYGLFQLYYSSSDDDYKLLRVTGDYSDPQYHVYIYSLKSDSWRKPEYESKVDIRPVSLCRDDWKPGINDWKPGIINNWKPDTTVLLNEKLYFLNETVPWEDYSVISFDTKTEKFTQIETPFEAKFSVSFFVLRGCIHLLCVYTYYELWRMEGDGDWTKVVPAFPWFLEPLQWRIKNFLRHSEIGKDLVSANRYPSLDESSWTPTKNTERSWTFLEYMETFVSPNQYTN